MNNSPYRLALIALACFALLGCSKKSDLVGSWRANMEGKNEITLNKDGTASAVVDTAILFGRAKSELQGSWKLLDGDRLLLEFNAGGVRTSEVSRFELVDGDLVLTRSDTGRSMRYTRVTEPDSSDSQNSSGKNSASGDEEQIRRNLRQIAAAADQFFLETGTETATYNQLTAYFKPLKSVSGEKYDGLVIRRDQPFQVTTADGRVILHSSHITEKNIHQ
jgi:hypothetical protein